MSAKRCSTCGLNYPMPPAVRLHNECLRCRDRLYISSNSDPMDMDEYRELVAEREAEDECERVREKFEKYYAEREAALLAQDLDSFANLGREADPDK